MRFLGRGLVQIALVAWTLFSLLPFVLITLFSLRDNQGLTEHPFGVGGELHPENYAEAFAGPYGSAGMGAFLANSVIAAVTALVVNLALGASAAYFATGLSARAQNRLMRLFLLGTVVPFVLLLIPYYRQYQALDLLNSPAALGVAYGVIGLPTTVLVLNAFYRDFPQDLREAAAIDGLGPVRTFLRIVLPLSRGPLGAAGLLLLVWVWNETQLAIVLLQDADSLTVPVGVLGFQQLYTIDYGPIFAGLSIAMVPILLLYCLFSRTIRSGLSLTGAGR